MGSMWSGRRQTKIQATTRNKNLWPEVWSKMGKPLRRKKSKKGQTRNPSSIMLEGREAFICICPEDDQCKESIKNTRKSWKFHWMRLCHASKERRSTPRFRKLKREVEHPTRFQKTKHACIVEYHESTRNRLESSLPKIHEDHTAGKGHNSISHYNLVRKFIPMPQSMKIPAAKAAADKEWKKLETIPPWQLKKVMSK